jgi:hypothetical protein
MTGSHEVRGSIPRSSISRIKGLQPCKPFCIGPGRLHTAPPRRLLIGKANHLTGHFAAKQSRKRLVDVLQCDLARDHLV